MILEKYSPSFFYFHFLPQVSLFLYFPSQNNFITLTKNLSTLTEIFSKVFGFN